MKGRYHELISFVTLVILLTTLHYYKVYNNTTQLTGAWILGTLYLSPDLDAPHSRSKNRIGHFKYLFRFCRHRGLLHQPAFWGCVFMICLHFGYMWPGIGLAGAAITHILLDRV